MATALSTKQPKRIKAFCSHQPLSGLIKPVLRDYFTHPRLLNCFQLKTRLSEIFGLQGSVFRIVYTVVSQSTRFRLFFNQKKIKVFIKMPNLKKTTQVEVVVVTFARRHLAVQLIISGSVTIGFRLLCTLEMSKMCDQITVSPNWPCDKLVTCLQCTATSRPDSSPGRKPKMGP